MPASPVQVVGLGSSAGGLSALKEFFAVMAPDSGRAFVVIQHLQPDGPTLTQGILARVTSMVVVTASDGVRVQPDHVYTMPPGTQVTIANGRLNVAPRTETGAQHHPFDRFLFSLALDCGARAIAVVLSGYDGDGAEGFVAIKAQGGITYAQDGTAAVRHMPESATATGCVDHVLGAEAIAAHIAAIRGQPEPSATAAAAARRRAPEPSAARDRDQDP